MSPDREDVVDIMSDGVPSFEDRVRAMNLMYDLQVSKQPALPFDLIGRLAKFRRVMIEEIDEINLIIAALESGASDLALITDVADLLGDLTVYVQSEAIKYGIPLQGVLTVIMDSNQSKLGEDGLPIIDPETGKFLKGPNYWKPEPKISELLAETADLRYESGW